MHALLLDFNGVLVDDEHVHLAAFNAVLEPKGIVLSEQAYWDRYLGFDDRGAFEAALDDHGKSFTSAEIERLIHAKAERYLHVARTGLRFFAGAAELIRAAAQSVPVAVVSGALRAEIELALAMLGVQAEICTIVAAEDVNDCKPHPAGYLLAVDRLAAFAQGLRAPRCVAVEDSMAGLESARAAGVCAVGVAHSYPTERLIAAGAVRVFESIREIAVGDLVACLPQE